ncbi:MAG: Cna B-type domain-containing protein, partial [Clostridia bacterium]|nr:Cna B-type domain-containing protein [Clostridia bacterium]
DGSDTDRTEEDRVIAFTYDVVINKVDEDGNALEGAEFKLEKKLADDTTEEIDRVTVKDNTIFTFNGLDDGTYVLTETKQPIGYKAIDPIEFTVTAEHEVVWAEGKDQTDILTGLTGDVVTGELKLEADADWSQLTGDVVNEEAEQPKFEKKIKDTNDTTGETSEWQDSADYDIGDAVPYKLTATLASNVTDYKAYHIIFHDTLDENEGLDFNGIQKVLVNGEEVTGYEITPAEPKQWFELKMAWGEGADKPIDASLNSAEIEVYFTATLNENAKRGNEGNVNTGYLEYSCNPNVEDGSDTDRTEEDRVIAFTYDVVINKVDDDGNALEGAEFKLEKKLAGDNTEEIDRVTVTDNTIFTFKGLDDGTYVLTETKHPDGYKGIDPIEFTVTADHEVVWAEGKDRTEILTGLTGDVVTGELKLEADADWSQLTGDVKNEKLTSAIVKKVWDDDNDRDGLRPENIQVKLLADGEDVDTYELNADNNWMKRVDDLPKTKDGELIKYTWEEVTECEGYELPIIGGTAVLTTLTNRHAPDRTVLRVRKVWNDSENKAGKRPDGPIIAQIFADGVAVDAVELDESNGWISDSWTGPKYTKDADGKRREIVYTVVEMNVPDGYVCTITKNTKELETEFVITNTFETGSLIIEKEFEIEPWEPSVPDDSPIDIPVIKTWNDNGNRDGNRPEEITVRLYADGEEIDNAKLTEETSWRYTFTGLPRLTEENEKIVYTITEDAVEGYETEINGFNIRNNYKPELTSVTVTKVWDDNNNEAKKRPTSIAMTLSNGMVVILDAENNWTATIDNLPTKVNGETVTYTWKEQQVLNYDNTDVSTADGVTTFTNKYVKKTPTTGETKPNTPTHGTPKEELDDYRTPLGVNVIINHVGDCFD